MKYLNIVFSVSMEQADQFRQYLTEYKEIQIREEYNSPYNLYRRFSLLYAAYDYSWVDVRARAIAQGIIVERMEAFEDN
jgi:hypothetical protein